MKATANVLCYKLKTFSNGEHPIMLRVCKGGKKKYVSLGISVNPKYWDFQKNKPKRNCPNREQIIGAINEQEQKFSEQILEFSTEQREYSPANLIETVAPVRKAKTVDDLFNDYICQLKEEGSLGYALSAQQVHNSLLKFKRHLNIYFSEIDVNWLKAYESWLRCCKLADNAIGICFRTLQIMPARNRRTLGLGEYAEEAVIVEEATLSHLQNECITPVFSKDNELTINHAAFIETIQDAASSFFSSERVEQAGICCSHIVKGRIPEAIRKPVNQLLESDKTIYYERCAFSIDIPTIYETVGGNKLNLTIVGVRAYNQMNLFSKKSPELFRLAIGFKNQVCCNMCIFTKDELRVSDTAELYCAALELFDSYNPAKHLHLMQSLGNTSMSEHQFCQILGKMRLYQCLPNGYQKSLPRMLLTDTQINSVAKACINDENFGSFGNDLNMWKFYNLLTDANKSSHIDSFLDRSLNATEMAVGISSALHGDEKY